MKIALLFVVFTVCSSHASWAQNVDVKPADMKEARAVVRDVMELAVSRAIQKTPQGDYYVRMLMNPTAEERGSVYRLGDAAIDALAEYLKDKNGYHQWIALRLLVSFRNEKALFVLEDFATDSFVRREAVNLICDYPMDETHSFLEKLAKINASSEVGDAAKKCLQEHKKP